jgi:hypothetical protein
MHYRRYPAGIRQINGILEENGALCMFWYEGSNLLQPDWQRRSHEYVHRESQKERKEFRLPCSWIDSEKTVAMTGSFNYDTIRTLDVNFTNTTLTGKIRPATTNNKNDKTYTFHCHCGKEFASTISYNTRDDPLWFTKMKYCIRICPDCKISFFCCSCFGVKNDFHEDVKVCLRCYNDKRQLVKRGSHIEFWKCDIEIFFDKYFNRLQPWIVKRLKKGNGLRRCDRTTTLPYPSTFQP